ANAPVDKKLTQKAENREEMGLRGWPTWTDIGLAPVGFAVYLMLAAVLTAIFTVFPWFDPGETQNIGFSLTLTGFDRIVAFATLVVVAPIAEEIIFRGWLYGKLRAKLSEKVSNVAGMIISILLVSVLFGVVHLQWNVGVNVFALSVVLCGLREITGTIYAGILLHMLKNGVAFYMLYVLGVS
ncbi:MAG: CPBP family intramembrane metalloprotease, partial [Candidatus Saccharibacteria bacterium]|nr:CPBP family intramembrane metalloprotease [Candidatus Saccharibacteria bacterium]